MKRRTAVLSIAATLTLTAAGFAAAHGRPPQWPSKPSTTPPPRRDHGHHHFPFPFPFPGHDHGQGRDQGGHDHGGHEHARGW